MKVLTLDYKTSPSRDHQDPSFPPRQGMVNKVCQQSVSTKCVDKVCRPSVSTKYVNKEQFDGHIVLTDMCAPKPVPSKCQRMWMTDSDNARNPYFTTNERVIAIES